MSYDKLMNHEILSKREEQRLIHESQRGNLDSRDKLLLSNMKLIRKVCSGYSQPEKNVTTDDLIADGIEGFLYAVDKFDTSVGTRLSTYATLAVMHRVGRSSILNSVIRFPEYIKKEVSKINKARSELVREGESEPSLTSISERSGISLEKVEKHALLATTAMDIISLSDPVGNDSDDEEGLKYADVLPVEETDFNLSEIRMDLDFFLSKLPEMHRFILSRSYGVGGPELSDRKLGKLLKLSHTHIQSMRKDSLESLQRLARAINGTLGTARLAIENPQKVMNMKTLSTKLKYELEIVDGNVQEKQSAYSEQQQLIFAMDR